MNDRFKTMTDGIVNR